MTTLAILSVSAGAGHMRAAEAVAAAATARGLTPVHIDVMELVPKLFRRIYADSYLGLVNRHPAFWGYLYHASDAAKPDSALSRMRGALERLNTRQFMKRLRELAPAQVVCTHFLPAQLLSRLRGEGEWSTPVWTVVTDFDVHALWVQPHLSGYCVAAEEIAWRLRDRGIGATPVAVTGIPIAPAFASPPARGECARELGLDPARTTVLLMSGGFGVGAIDQLAARLLAIPGDFQMVALAGRNAELLARLHGLAGQHPGRLVAQGFTRTPERIMACADLAITKPGGLTTSECLAMGLPLLAVSPIPGQEERNADFLLEHGAGLKAHDAAGVEYRVRELLAAPARLAAMAAAARAAGRPGAAAAVLDRVLAPA